MPPHIIEIPNLNVKDIYYIITICGAIVAYLYRQRQNNADIKRINMTLYHEQGGLNVVTCAQCKEFRDIVFTSIRNAEKRMEDQTNELKVQFRENTKELRILNGRVHKIMIKLEIDTERDIV